MHLGMSYTEIYKLPIRYREWYLNRLVEHFKQRNEARSGKVSDPKPINQGKSFSDYQDMINKKFGTE